MPFTVTPEIRSDTVYNRILYEMDGSADCVHCCPLSTCLLLPLSFIRHPVQVFPFHFTLGFPRFCSSPWGAVAQWLERLTIEWSRVKIPLAPLGNISNFLYAWHLFYSLTIQVVLLKVLICQTCVFSYQLKWISLVPGLRQTGYLSMYQKQIAWYLVVQINLITTESILITL